VISLLQFPIGLDIVSLKGFILKEKNVPIPQQTFALMTEEVAPGSSKVLIDPLSLADYKEIQAAAGAKAPIKIKVSFAASAE
jgi:hypothetical protein